MADNHRWKGEDEMPKINQPLPKNLSERFDVSSETSKGKKNTRSAKTEQKPRINDSLEKRNNISQRTAFENLSLSRTGEQISAKGNIAKSLSEKPTRQANPAQNAYNRGLPLVYRTDAKIHGGLVLVLHGSNNQKASIVDAQSATEAGSINLAFESLMNLDGPPQSQDSWNTTRVVVAAMFQAGLLVNKDNGMARHMMSRMADSERNSGLNSALMCCVGQDLPLMRALLNLGAKPNEVFFDDEVLPLQAAIGFGKEAFVKLLLEKGADPDSDASSSGITPREFALRHGSKEINSIITSWGKNNS